MSVSLDRSTLDRAWARLGSKARTKQTDYLLRGLGSAGVEAVDIKIPAFHGTFSCPVSSDLTLRLMRDRTYETDLADWIATHAPPNCDSIDVGANLGFFSVLLAAVTGGRVAAFEPSTEILGFLRRNLARNIEHGSVEVIAKAAAETGGSALLHAADGRPEYSSLAPLVHGRAVTGSSSVATVPTITIDEVCGELGLQPKVIKLDCEGGELAALRGATATLKNHRPKMLIEVFEPMLIAHGSSSHELGSFLQEFDYNLTDLSGTPVNLSIAHRLDLVAIPN